MVTKYHLWFLAYVGQITLKKKFTSFFFPKDDIATIIYNFLLLRPCTLFILQTSQNRFRFFIILVSSFWFWQMQYYLHDPTASTLYGLLSDENWFALIFREKGSLHLLCSSSMHISVVKIVNLTIKVIYDLILF